jgi:hypothetical protein
LEEVLALEMTFMPSLPAAGSKSIFLHSFFLWGGGASVLAQHINFINVNFYQLLKHLQKPHILLQLYHTISIRKNYYFN